MVPRLQSTVCAQSALVQRVGAPTMSWLMDIAWRPSTVEETDDRKDAAQKVRVERGAETRRRHKADRA